MNDEAVILLVFVSGLVATTYLYITVNPVAAIVVLFFTASLCLGMWEDSKKRELDVGIPNDIKEEWR